MKTKYSPKPLKGILVSLFFFVLLLSCSSTKKVSEIVTKNDVKTEAEVSKKTDIATGTQVATDQNRKENKQSDSNTQVNNQEQTNTSTIKYDTGKPIVPGTGRPPVLEETITNRQLTGTIQNQTREIYSLQEINRSLLLKVSIMQHQVDSLVRVTDKTKLAASAEDETESAWPWGAGVNVAIILAILLFCAWQSRGLIWKFIKSVFHI